MEARNLLVLSITHLQNGLLTQLFLASLQNVLHWHIVDTQSFPLEIPSYPKLWDGAYSTSERYTVADAAEIVRHVLADFVAPLIFS